MRALWLLAFAFLLLQRQGISGASLKRERSNKKWPGRPVVLIPGFGGSQLEANLTGKPSVVHYVCSKQTADFFDLWLNLELFTPLVIDCWVDNMQMIYDPKTAKSANMPGVDIRVPGFGNTSTVEWLDPSKASEGKYFSALGDALVAKGYRRGKDLVGAPFDWRKSPVELGDYFVQLKALIENTYRWNENRKVVVVAHSMGNPTALYFYNKIVDQAWKEKYVDQHVAIAAPWGGSMQIVRLLASGYNMNYYRIVLPPSKLRAMQRSFTSSVFLFPSKTAWHETKDVLATNDGKNYTVSNAKEFFMDAGYPLGWDQYQASGRLLEDLNPPGVKTICIYGWDVQTPEKLHWAKGYWPDYPPSTTDYGDGDGTVNRKSAERCAKWTAADNQGSPVTSYAIRGAEHMAILGHAETINYVLRAVQGDLY